MISCIYFAVLAVFLADQSVNPKHTTMNPEIVTIGLVEDNKLFRTTLATTLNQHKNYRVVLQAWDGVSLQAELQKGTLPNVLLLDLRMKGMDGFDTLKWLNEVHPNLPVIILSGCRFEITMGTFIRLGASSVLPKAIDPEELFKAIDRVLEEGYYFPDARSRNLWRNAYHEKDEKVLRKHLFSERQWRLLKLAGTGLTYIQIGALLDMSEACVKKHLHGLYEDLEVQNRAELALLAERHGIMEVNAEPRRA